MKDRVKELTKRIASLERAVAAAPPGRLKYRKRGSSYHYIQILQEHGVRQERYLPASETERIAALAQKRYDKKLLRVLKAELTALQHNKVFDAQAKFAVYEALPPPVAAFVCPVFRPAALICAEWAQGAYEPNPFQDDTQPTYQTEKGDCVRSKNEWITANKLLQAGLAYRYEAPLEVWNGKVYYPDFTIMHPKTNELYYLEVCGIMGDPDYVAHLMQKMHDYTLSGLSGRILLLFEHPAVPFDPNEIDALIRHVFGA